MAEERKEMIIGTREAAVLSCVNVIAAVTAQREELLVYWLDLYYQVRLAYEREIHPELFTAAPAPVVPVMRPEDVYSAVRQIWENRIEHRETETAEGTTSQEATPEEEPVKKPSGWAMKKRRTVERLEAARARGVTYAQLIEISRGRLTETTISAALNAGKLSRREWQDITAALDDLEAAG